jgi:hypothetical protein
MLLLLTDEHITSALAKQIGATRPDISIQSIHMWQRSELVAKPDRILLRAAHNDRLTLITFDQKTIPPLLSEFALNGIEHSGVIFVDERTLASRDIGGLLRAVIAFYDRYSEWDWTNRIGFLEAVR